jgi:Rod binding domain-containing protein
MSPVPSVAAASSPNASPQLEDAFRQVVGNVFYGELLKSLRQTLGKPAYIHGGQAEELFQSQLDHYVVEDLASRENGPWMNSLLQQFLRQLNPGAAPADALQSLPFAKSVQSAGTAALADLSEAARQTQPALDAAGNTSGAAALSALIRK